MKYRFLFFLLTLTSTLLAQLTITVTSIPANTPQDDDIHIAGNFQGWVPDDPAYILDNNGDGTYEITIEPDPGQLEFKFTRGSWPTVEGNASGGFLPNRTYNYDGTTSSLEVEILSWEDLGGSGGNSTAADNVQILDEDFFIPQLNRNRRIWIYLPPDYNTSSKYYPVIYMHDGQNLFDAETSFAGEWEVDESLNELFDMGDYGCIVVGIDNGGGYRADEYAPWYNADYDAGGEGEEYIDFIVETLKPYVDVNYRTLPGRKYTCLFGSSLGALISQYGILEHQDVFSKAGVFSPAFWFNPEIFNFSADTPKEEAMKIYMLAGIPEGNGSVVADVNQMESVLLNNGFNSEELNKAFHPDGQHSEWYWAREFPWAYLWLFDDVNLTAASETQSSLIRIYPNPVDTLLYLDNLPELKRPVARLYNLEGKLILREKLEGNSLDISDVQPGVYVLKITAKQRFAFSEKVMVR